MTSDKYQNIYGESIANPESESRKTIDNRFSEIEKVLESGEVVIIDDEKVVEIYDLISGIGPNEIEVNEDDIENLINDAWYNSELELFEWKEESIAKIKSTLIIKSIQTSEAILGKSFTKKQILTINRLIQNFIRFVEKDNIHIEYVIIPENSYKTAVYPFKDNIIYEIENNSKIIENICNIRYRDYKYGIVISNFNIDENLNIDCVYYPLDKKTLLSYGRTKWIQKN